MVYLLTAGPGSSEGFGSSFREVPNRTLVVHIFFENIIPLRIFSGSYSAGDGPTLLLPALLLILFPALSVPFPSIAVLSLLNLMPLLLSPLPLSLALHSLCPVPNLKPVTLRLLDCRYMAFRIAVGSYVCGPGWGADWTRRRSCLLLLSGLPMTLPSS